jgi:lincosamide nucleotidyltransferase A/C/D/E
VGTADVLGVLDRLDAAGIEWWVDGGWGIDALLGEETRPHERSRSRSPASGHRRLPALFTEYTRVEEEWWPARFVCATGTGVRSISIRSSSTRRATAGRS